MRMLRTLLAVAIYGFLALNLYSCKKQDSMTKDDQYSHLPLDIANAARWYDQQILPNTKPTDFAGENKPDWKIGQINKTDPSNMTIVVPAYQQKWTKGTVSRELHVNLDNGIYTGHIKEFKKRADSTFVSTLSINGRFIDEGYMNSAGKYIVTKKGGKRTFVLMGYEDDDFVDEDGNTEEDVKENGEDASESTASVGVNFYSSTSSKVPFDWVVVANTYGQWQVRSFDEAEGYKLNADTALVYSIDHKKSEIEGQTEIYFKPKSRRQPVLVCGIVWQESSYSTNIASNYMSGTVTVSGDLYNITTPLKSVTNYCTVIVH